MNPRSAAIIGLLFSLPFLIANFVVALRIEPFYSFLGSFSGIRNNMLLPLLLLLLFPIGALMSAYPMFQKNGGKRKIYAANLIISIIMLVIFSIIFIGLGEDYYKCEIQKIPNCD